MRPRPTRRRFGVRVDRFRGVEEREQFRSHRLCSTSGGRPLAQSGAANEGWLVRFAVHGLELAAHAAELRALLSDWFGRRTKHEIYHAAQALKVPAGMVATVGDLLESEQYAAREFWQTVD